MDSARKAAYLALRDVEENKAYSNFAVQNAIDKVNTDRAAFVRELVYGTIKKQLYLDFLIGHFIKTPVEKLPASDRVLLRLGFYQATSLDSVPDYAAVFETVELAKRYARGRGPFINGVMRQYLRDRENMALPPAGEDEVRRLSITYSFAPWIVRMWLGEFENEERVERLLEALNSRPELCIRANTLKVEPKALKTQLENLGFIVEADEDLPDIFFVEGEQLLGTSLYKEGMFSVQDKASRIAAESLGARPGETVIDVCAAPGGKTMAIAEAMGNKGKIIAADIHEKKIGLIEKEAARLGIKIVTAKRGDGRIADPALAGAFDRALVDAPCSGLGVVRRKPEIKYKEFDEAMRGLPGMQLDILTASANYIKPGGVLVYSTCTIAKRENQDVVDAFLRANSRFELVDKIQLLPMTGKTDGFFVCKLKRTGTIFGG
ncbi:MAG: 16S rRNA (cytosine(967)-C(5))-methyltransferase RsmB [Clostridiales bacterium]|nr:16S rRNA (cytosine(967)-C(5))-methyltransferase RsmB [Clostridiales bacterium]